MQCPKCDGEMIVKNYGRKISVNRCADCMGLFAMPEVLLEMKSEWMAEGLEAGDPKVGRKLNEVEDISCPNPSAKMDKVADEQQTHIWYERCPDCSGIYFDAGEFTDWKYDTLLDRIRDLIRGRRDG